MISLLSCVQFVPSLILNKPHFPIILRIMPSNFSSMSFVTYAVLFLLVMAATNISFFLSAAIHITFQFVL